MAAPRTERSRQLFEQAVALDPMSRRGLAGVTMSNVNLVLWLRSDDPARDVARAGARFLAGRDRIIARAGELGLPP